MNTRRLKFLSKRIGVLYGGLSSEREVSLETGRAMASALKRKGYKVSLIDQGRDVAAQLVRRHVDVALLALHGRYGEDGHIQGLLETMGVPYTGTDLLGSAVAMDKHLTKILLQEAGLPVAPFLRIFRPQAPRIRISDLPFPLPAVVKPVSEGSSVGISIVKRPSELLPALDAAFDYGETALIEKFIPGMEVSVALLSGEALGVVWIKPKRAFYDYKAKYQTDSTRYIYPAPLPPETYHSLLTMAESANALVGGEGATRVDFIVGEKESVILEINTLPGMTSHSLVPKIAEAEGIPFDDLVERILFSARLHLAPRHTKSSRAASPRPRRSES